MENKGPIIVTIILLAIVLILSSILYFVSRGNEPSSSPSNLEECKTLSFSSDSAVNLVFFADKATAEKYSSYLLSVSPFAERKEAFNTYYIDSFSPECELYKGIALLCYSKPLILKAASCPNDYIIALQSKPESIRSSSYMNVLSLNTNHPLSVIQHEFAHALAFLAEEYVPAEIPSKSKNCVSSCSKFTNPDGCFEGCSKSDYFRSIDSGIMRTLYSNNFGTFDEEILLSRLPENSEQKTTGNAISNSETCANQNYYLIESTFDSNDIKVLNKEIHSGCPSSNGFGDFNLTLSSTNFIQSGSFNPLTIFTDAQSEQEQISGEILQSDIPFYLSLPALDSSSSLQISNGQITKIIKLNDLSSYPCRI